MRCGHPLSGCGHWWDPLEHFTPLFVRAPISIIGHSSPHLTPLLTTFIRRTPYLSSHHRATKLTDFYVLANLIIGPSSPHHTPLPPGSLSLPTTFQSSSDEAFCQRKPPFALLLKSSFNAMQWGILPKKTSPLLSVCLPNVTIPLHLHSHHQMEQSAKENQSCHLLHC